MQWKLGKGGKANIWGFQLFFTQVQEDMKTELGDQFEAIKVTFLSRSPLPTFLSRPSNA